MGENDQKIKELPVCDPTECTERRERPRIRASVGKLTCSNTNAEFTSSEFSWLVRSSDFDL